MQNPISITPLSDMSWLGINHDTWYAGGLVASIITLLILLVIYINFLNKFTKGSQAQPFVKLSAFSGTILMAVGTVVIGSSLYAVHTIEDTFGNQVSQTISEQGIDTSQGCIKEDGEVKKQDCSDIFDKKNEKVNFITIADNKHHEVFVTEDTLLIGDNLED